MLLNVLELGSALVVFLFATTRYSIDTDIRYNLMVR
jgi:hypothetical protein